MEKFNIKNGLSVGSNKLDIIDATGSLSATSITLSGQYTLPLTDGTAQQIIETDGAGNLSFVENTALTTMNSNSGGWESTRTTVTTNSANWSYVAANSGFSYTDFYVTGDIYATGSLSADSIKFNTEAGITPGVGELTWNADEESLDYGVNNDVTLQIGQEQLIHVKAEENIKNGQAVYASGASGAGSGNITARLYRAGAGDIEELYFIGVATQDISTDEFGFVSTFGKVRGVQVADTRASDDPQALSASNEGWDIGTILYVSPVEAGKYTQTKPVAPDKDIPVVMIISENGNQRTFFTRYEHGYCLDEIHDVSYNEPIGDGDLLTWNDSISAWQNLPEADPIFSIWAQSVSSNYDSTYTTVQTNSADWAPPSVSFNESTAELTVGSNTASLSSLSEGLNGIAYNRWNFTGNGALSTFSVTGAVSEPSEAYTVTIDAAIQDPDLYTIDKDGDIITFNSPPPLSSYIVVVEQYAAAASSGVTTGKAIAMAIVFG